MGGSEHRMDIFFKAHSFIFGATAPGMGWTW